MEIMVSTNREDMRLDLVGLITNGDLRTSFAILVRIGDHSKTIMHSNSKGLVATNNILIRWAI